MNKKCVPYMDTMQKPPACFPSTACLEHAVDAIIEAAVAGRQYTLGAIKRRKRSKVDSANQARVDGVGGRRAVGRLDTDI